MGQEILISCLQSPFTVILEATKKKKSLFPFFPIYLWWSHETRWHDFRYIYISNYIILHISYIIIIIIIYNYIYNYINIYNYIWQCFRWTARWFSYTNIYMLFFKLFFIIFCYKILTIDHYAIQKSFVLVAYLFLN